jgi:hypothetical protein
VVIAEHKTKYQSIACILRILQVYQYCRYRNMITFLWGLKTFDMLEITQYFESAASVKFKIN